MKNLFNKLVELMQGNVVYAAVAVGVCALVVLVLLFLLIGTARRKKKAKRAAAAQAIAQQTTPQPKPTPTEPPVKVTTPQPKPTPTETPVKVTTPQPKPVEVAQVETMKPQPKPVEAVQAKTAQPKPVSKKAETVEKTELPKAAPTQEMKEKKAPTAAKTPKKTPKAEAATAEKEVKMEKTTQNKKVPQVQPKAVALPAEDFPMQEENEPMTTVKESPVPAPKKPLSLLDELKDVNTDISFYEEDAFDTEARYKGKWVICRVVTDDNADDETYFFELHASNGEKLLTSEEYTTYNGVLRGIQTHKTNILKGNFRVTVSKRGEYIFKLLSGKNLLLCMGEGYATKARCEAAIESTKRFAKTAIIDENIQDQVIKVPVEDDSPIEPPKEGCKGKWIINCVTSAEGESTYFFELFANNGERLLSSEEYTTYIGAVNGIQTHKMNISKGNFRISLTKRGDYIYKLLNSNGQLLCLGEHYKTKRLCQNAVESVKRFAFNSPVLTNPNIKE